MFTPDYRAGIRESLIQKARQDTRIESAAAVGGSAQGEPDQWSDLDLSFGVSDGARDEVLADWTASLRSDFDAVTLFDLPFMSTLYRVFLFPGALQVDLSFTPSEEFGALGPRFALLFGTAVERRQPPLTSPRQEFGLAAHHAVRAHFALRRGRVWQAEHWMSLVRDHALTLACRRLGLEAANGRGFDFLPVDIRAEAASSLARSLEPDELSRALSQAVNLLMHESEGVHEDAARITTLLRELEE